MKIQIRFCSLAQLDASAWAFKRGYLCVDPEGGQGVRPPYKSQNYTFS